MAVYNQLRIFCRRLEREVSLNEPEPFINAPRSNKFAEVCIEMLITGTPPLETHDHSPKALAADDKFRNSTVHLKIAHSQNTSQNNHKQSKTSFYTKTCSNSSFIRGWWRNFGHHFTRGGQLNGDEWHSMTHELWDLEGPHRISERTFFLSFVGEPLFKRLPRVPATIFTATAHQRQLVILHQRSPIKTFRCSYHPRKRLRMLSLVSCNWQLDSENHMPGMPP